MQQTYSEIYTGGTGEKQANGYFEKWGWYATINRMAKGKVWRFEYIENMNVHAFHLNLAHDIDLQKMKAKLRRGKNTTEL